MTYVDAILRDVEDWRERALAAEADNDHLRARMAEAGLELIRQRRTAVTVSDNAKNLVGGNATSWPPQQYHHMFRYMMENGG